MADKRRPGPSSDVAERLAERAKKGNGSENVPVILHDSLLSLADLVNQMGEAFPSNAEFDSFKFPSTLGYKEVRDLTEKYPFPPCLEVMSPDPGDRTCNWHPERLFVYKGAIEAGLRFPLHHFVVRLLAELGVHPCQLYPNSWSFIFIFVARCLKEGLVLSVPVFLSIFNVKNSPGTRKGWVSIQHRTRARQICCSASLPDSHHEWRHHFVVLHWKGGDWGRFFRPSFNHVHDRGSCTDLFGPAECIAFNELTSGHEGRHYRAFLTESIMVKIGLSRLSTEGNF